MGRSGVTGHIYHSRACTETFQFVTFTSNDNKDAE